MLSTEGDGLILVIKFPADPNDARVLIPQDRPLGASVGLLGGLGFFRQRAQKLQ